MTRGNNRSDRRSSSVVGLLDIGTSKVAAAVLVQDPKPASNGDAYGGMRIAGLGMHRSRGVKAGVLTDLDEAETAVRGAISQAERAAGLTLDSVIVSVACGRLKSQHFAAGAEIQGGIAHPDRAGAAAGRTRERACRRVRRVRRVRP